MHRSNILIELFTFTVFPKYDSHMFLVDYLTVTQAGQLNDSGVGLSFGLNLNLN